MAAMREREEEQYAATNFAPGPGEPIGRRTALSMLVALLPWGSRPLLSGQPARASALEPWDPGMEVAITFQIGDPRSAAGRRPYLTVYVEDPDGKAVRTVVLWAQKQIAWLRQLRYWYRAEVERQRGEGGNLVSTLTSATRLPGTYTVVWDGRDNAGDYVERGRYVILIETIRQNAGNHLVRREFSFGSEPFRQEVEPYASISNVVVEYRKSS
jgi:FAD:protein FMN transferase